mmetsp:Transcript_102933/g.327173  ORF Transcript_102933/g.327173 Transcript_102933/m.327173 type:complete len:254 (+) Transcript_102933:1534-2295(+)
MRSGKTCMALIFTKQSRGVNTAHVQASRVACRSSNGMPPPSSSGSFSLMNTSSGAFSPSTVNHPKPDSVCPASANATDVLSAGISRMPTCVPPSKRSKTYVDPEPSFTVGASSSGSSLPRLPGSCPKCRCSCPGTGTSSGWMPKCGGSEEPPDSRPLAGLFTSASLTAAAACSSATRRERSCRARSSSCCPPPWDSTLANRGLTAACSACRANCRAACSHLSHSSLETQRISARCAMLLRTDDTAISPCTERV